MKIGKIINVLIQRKEVVQAVNLPLKQVKLFRLINRKIREIPEKI